MKQVERRGDQPSFEAFIPAAHSGKSSFRPVACRRTHRAVQAITGSGRESLAPFTVQRQEQDLFGDPITPPRGGPDLDPVGRALGAAGKARRIDEVSQATAAARLSAFPNRRAVAGSQVRLARRESGTGGQKFDDVARASSTKVLRQPPSCQLPVAVRQSSHSQTRRNSARCGISGTDITTTRIRSRTPTENSSPYRRMPALALAANGVSASEFQDTITRRRVAAHGALSRSA